MQTHLSRPEKRHLQTRKYRMTTNSSFIQTNIFSRNRFTVKTKQKENKSQMKTEQTNQPKTWTFHRDLLRRKKTGELDKALREDMRTERQTVRNLFHWTDAGVWPGRVWTLRTASLQLTTCENGARLNTWSSTCTTSVDERERQRERHTVERGIYTTVRRTGGLLHIQTQARQMDKATWHHYFTSPSWTFSVFLFAFLHMNYCLYRVKNIED